MFSVFTKKAAAFAAFVSVTLTAMLFLVLPAVSAQEDTGTTEAPPTTAAGVSTPPTTQAIQSIEDIPTWIWIIIGALALWIIVMLFKSLINHSRRRKVRKWQKRAKPAFTGAQWLYNTLTQELAVWRGGVLFQNAQDPESPDAQVWAEIPAQMTQTIQELHTSAEKSVVPNGAAVCNALVAALVNTRDSMTVLGQARCEYLELEDKIHDETKKAADSKAAVAAYNQNLKEAQTSSALQTDISPEPNSDASLADAPQSDVPPEDAPADAFMANVADPQLDSADDVPASDEEASPAAKDLAASDSQQDPAEAPVLYVAPDRTAEYNQDLAYAQRLSAALAGQRSILQNSIESLGTLLR